MRYMERMAQVVDTYADRIAFATQEESITYGQLDEESARVYAYLKERGIGRETFVHIMMPKDVHFFSCVLGVWKAGAAYVLIEEGYPKDRIDFIVADVGSVLCLDKALFQTIQTEVEPIWGHVETDLHDSAYAVYTSGSTGNPKGILHEFGNVDQGMVSFGDIDPSAIFDETRFCYMASLNFVATQLFLLPATARAETCYLVSSELLRDFSRLQTFLANNHIQRMFFPPSYLRRYKNPCPSLMRIYTGSAPAHGIFFDGKPEVVNTFAMSETGFFALWGILDRSYEVAPVGTPSLDVGVCLMDEDGQVVEGPGRGELCFANDYVRGYINLSEQTERAFRLHEGKRLFHTNDMVERDDEGRYYIVGRLDDMVKIDGNRIEPAEIEAAVKTCTGLPEVLAKGFVNDRRAYVAVYFVEADARALGLWDGTTLAIDREKLAQMLPSYMIPTYYVALDQLPVNANNKLTRKDLPEPDAATRQRPYAAARTDVEHQLVAAIEQVLELEHVGIDDDFFEIGGDSMSAIMLVETCSGLDLSAKLVYGFRTVRRIAEQCGNHVSTAVLAQEREQALSSPWPLLAGQRQNVYFQAYAPESPFENISHVIELTSAVDLGRMTEALRRVLRRHPPVVTRITRDKNGELTQRYDPTLMSDPQLTLVEEDRLDDFLSSLNAPFVIEDSCLYRAGVVASSERRYLYLIFHHVISDGSSLKLLLGEVLKSYADPNYVGAPDDYFVLLKRAAEARHSVSWNEAREHFANLFDRRIATGTPLGVRCDRESEDRTSDSIRYEDVFDRKPHYDANFFLCAVALAEAWYNDCDHAFVVTVHNNRDDRTSMAAAGYLASFIAVCLEMPKGEDVRPLLRQARDQMAFAISHATYSYIDDKIGDSSCMTRFIYQKNLLGNKVTNPIIKDVLQTPRPQHMPGVLSINVIDNDESQRLSCFVRYATECFDLASIERFSSLFFKAVAYLDEHLS